LGRNQKGGIGEAIMVGPAQPQFVWQKGAEPIVAASFQKVGYPLVAMRLPPMREGSKAPAPKALVAVNVPLPPVRPRENVKLADAGQADPAIVGSINAKRITPAKASATPAAARAANVKTRNVKTAVKLPGPTGFSSSPDTIVAPGVFSGGQNTVSAGFQAN
jgi:hypothetical protein